MTPFGSSRPKNIFQEVMNNVTGDPKGVEFYQDGLNTYDSNKVYLV